MYNKLSIGILIGVVLGVLLTSTVVALGGSLNSSTTPASTSSYTLKEIYNRLNAGTTGSQSVFTEPGSGPTSTTMYTLNDIMAAAPAVDTTYGAAAEDVISGKKFWGLGTGGAWGLQTGSFPITGQSATQSITIPGTSKILDGTNSDSNPTNDPDTESTDVRLLLNPGSSDTLPDMIGVPSGYRYTKSGTTYDTDVAYPVSISTLIGTPTYDPYTGLPLVPGHSYKSLWVDCTGDVCSFNLKAPIALRLRSLRSEVATMAATMATLH